MQSLRGSVCFVRADSGPDPCMKVNFIKNVVAQNTGVASCFSIPYLRILLLAGLFIAWTARADDVDEVEAAVVKLASAQEKDGFDFRADIWERQLTPDLGKAVRVQFFKGNEYRVCVAVSPQSGVQIAAHVLDVEGPPVESKVKTAEGGWGVTLFVKPKRTGVF